MEEEQSNNAVTPQVGEEPVVESGAGTGNDLTVAEVPPVPTQAVAEPNVTVEEIAMQLAEHIELLNTQASSSIIDPTIAGLLGAAIGAVAALAGTYLSNRAQAVREAQAKIDQLDALVGALKGELAATDSAVFDKINILNELNELGGEVAVVEAVTHRLELPPSVVFESVADQLGLLGADRASQVARIYALKSTIEGVLKASQSRLLDGAFGANEIQEAVSNLEMFKKEIVRLKL